ncbi:MAG: disulfide bond formation protein B [Gammaproteobacteria bacterium]|nr:disulfide bond formation protein B [Gammaproteobacteria bacterium]
MKDKLHLGQAFILVVTSFVLSTSLYLQYIEALDPCPLCLMQRGITMFIFCFTLMTFFVFNVFRRCIIIGIQLFFAMAGAFFALRQLWLQSLPVADTGMCMPGVEMLIHKLPWHEVLQAFVWGGSTGCGEITWTFEGLSMAAWSFMYFSLIGILSVFFLVGLIRNERV